MNKEQKSRVREAVLHCREVLERDIADRLIDYGIYPDKESVPLEKLKHLDDQGRAVRRDLDVAILKERKAGLSYSEAVAHYVKEVSFTYLNRLAALRALEVRKIIPEVLVKRREYGNKSYGHRNWIEVVGELCAGEPDEGLSSFLRCVFDEISKEVRILFDTSDEYSLLFPSHTALSKVTQLLVEGVDEEVWKEDEIIGWIYQYFIEKEKDAIFERLFKEKKKIAGKDIAVVTQLFTPKWIVEWIVDNSLGALWQEMKEGKRPKKPVSEIKLLDPACGSGHFLLKAFDHFKRMYEEEGIIPPHKIPLAILRNNLYGIDVDLRAVQLSALAIYIKVKTIDKNLSVKEINLVCADAILLNGEKRKKLLTRTYQNKELEHIIDKIWMRFQNIREYGSLLRVENEIHSVIERETKGATSTQTTIIGWDQVEREILEQLREMAREALVTNDIAGQMFASEAEKSVHLLDYFMQQYDVVVTNPPYMGKRGMEDNLKDFLESFYPASGLDLYSAFIERCLDFATQGGLVGMVTQHTFMFINTYIDLRRLILRQCKIRALAHLGPHAFEEIKGEKVNNAMFVFEKTTLTDSPHDNIGLFIRVVREENKETAIREAMKSRADGSRIFYINQAEFEKIEGAPFVYWMPATLRQAFASDSPLEKFAEVKAGMQTGDNDTFVRYWWEVPRSSSKQWVPYVKGAGFSRYYAGIPHVLDWDESEIQRVPESAIRNKEYFFKEGLTFTLVSTGGFSCRLLPSSCIFDMGSPGIFATGISPYYLLGFLNSSVCRFLLKVLNPTINVQVGDVIRIPLRQPSSKTARKIETYTKECVQLARKKVILDELSRENDIPSVFRVSAGISLADACRLYVENQELSDVLLEIYQHLIDQEISGLYGLTQIDRELIAEEIGKSPAEFPVLRGHTSHLGTLPEGLAEHLMMTSQEDRDETDLTEKVRNLYFKEDLDLIEISQRLGIHPYSIYLCRHALGATRQTNLFQYCINMLSFFLGSIFGRFKLSGINEDSDGIAPRDILFEDDILAGLRRCFEVAFGENRAYEIEHEVESILGKKIQDWLISDFFEFHYRKYRKRPVIWHLRSERGYFHCFVYYQKLTNQTLHTIRGLYTPKKLSYVKERFRTALEDLTNARNEFNRQEERRLNKLAEELQEELEDIEKFDQDLKQIIESGYKPDLDKGVYANLKPLEKLLPIKVEK